MEYLHEKRFFGWFIYESGLGQNIFGIKSFLFEFFNIFLPDKGFEQYIIYIVYVKLLLISISMYFILRCRNVTYSINLAVLFSFSGMFIYWSNQYSNFTAILYIVLQFLGYEIFRLNNKRKYFILLSLPIFLYSVYYSIFACIFISIYILLDIIFDNKKYKHIIINLIESYVIILLITAFATLPELYVLSKNARISDNVGLFNRLFVVGINTVIGQVKIQDMYSLSFYAQFFLRGLFDNVLPVDKFWISAHSGPLWFSSVIILISSLSYCVGRFCEVKVKRITQFLLLMFLLLPLIVVLFNGFSDVRFRWSWMLLFPIYISAGKFWSEKGDFYHKQKRILIVSVVTLFLFLVCSGYVFFYYQIGFHNSPIVCAYFLILVILLLTIYLSYSKRLTFRRVLLISCMQVVSSGVYYIENTSAIDSKYVQNNLYYYDNTMVAINQIKSNDKEQFYRIDKLYQSVFLSDSLFQNYYGVKSYISTPNPAYFKFSSDMDAKPYYNFIFGFDGRYDVLRMLGVKYILSKQESEMSGYSLYNKVDNIYTYQANSYSGIGHVFHNYIKRNDFLKLSTLQKDLVFSRCTIFDSKQAATVKIESIRAQDCESMNSVLNNNTENFKLRQLNGRSVKGVANLRTSGVLYLAIPYDYGFSAKVDGKSVPVLNVSDGFIGLDLDAGQHEIELNYFPPLFKIGLIISGLTLLALIIYGSIKKTIRIKKKDE
jgi:uncharacterized membrane protein YfhO